MEDGGNDVSEEVVEDVTDNKSTEDVRQEVHAAKGTLEFDLGIQAEGHQKAQDVDEDGREECQFDREQVRFPDTGIGEQVDVVAKADPLIGAVALEIRKAVNKTFDQRKGVEQEKEDEDRDRDHRKGAFAFRDRLFRLQKLRLCFFFLHASNLL